MKTPRTPVRDLLADLLDPPRDPTHDRAARLMRWGWPPGQAQALAARIAARKADDARRRCVQCAHFKPWRCDAYKSAGLQSPDVGRDLSSLPQHCPAWAPREPAHE